MRGELFASYPPSAHDSIQVPHLLGQRKYLFADNHLYVTNVITDNNEKIGKVILKIELSDFKKMKASKFRSATILLFAAIAFSFILAIGIQTYFSKRLLYLVNTMSEVSETGNYNKKIPAEGKDEISTLIKEFNMLMQKVGETQQKKDEFIGIASHELKTPLTSIKGYMELLAMSEIREPNQHLVQKALENVNKLERLIKELLDVSKIQSGQLLLNMKEFKMDELLGETIQAFQIVTKTHQIIWEGDLNNGTVIADKQRIEQVVINLLSNAIKYSPGADKVIVNSRKTDKELIVKIRDFGIGVPKAEQSDIFERFYRSKELSKNFSGFGLGLYISRDIIKRHNGTIWMEMEEKGSAFYFSLPLKNGSPMVDHSTL
jgi:signal transduction histidine kinase